MKNNFTIIENYIDSAQTNKPCPIFDLSQLTQAELKEFEYKNMLEGQKNPLLNAIQNQDIKIVRDLLNYYSTNSHSPFLNTNFVNGLLDLLRDKSNKSGGLKELVNEKNGKENFYKSALEEIIAKLPENLCKQVTRNI